MKARCALRDQPKHKKEHCIVCLNTAVKEYGRELMFLRRIAMTAHQLLCGVDSVWRSKLLGELQAWAITPFYGHRSTSQRKVLPGKDLQ